MRKSSECCMRKSSGKSFVLQFRGLFILDFMSFDTHLGFFAPVIYFATEIKVV